MKAERQTMSNDLPALPDPDYIYQGVGGLPVESWGAMSVQAYARAAIAAHTERHDKDAQTHSVLQIGSAGCVYDAPDTRRAFTYKDQPGNVGASKLGRAALSTSRSMGGDSIDAGLALLRHLQAEGYGVFQLAAIDQHLKETK